MKKLKVNDLCDITINLVTSKKSIKNAIQAKELKIGMIKSKTLAENSDELTACDASRIFMVKKNDIIIKRVNPVFVTLILEDINMALGANLVCIRIKEKYMDKISIPYLAAYLDFKLNTYIREDATIPLLVAQKLKDLCIPLTDTEKQKAMGMSWVYNSLLYDKEKELADEKYEFNQNLIFKNMEEINESGK